METGAGADRALEHGTAPAMNGGREAPAAQRETRDADAEWAAE